MSLAAECEIPPDLFWSLTPFEFDAMVRGYRSRTRRMEHRFASVSATIMNMAGKSLKKGRTVEAEDLIDEGDATGAGMRDHDEEREYLKDTFDLRARGMC